eukprot:TRINITY_DN16636_c0_g1_i1.p1 TRINITY_DN16636_c0_g1~~TRINITY_DN16636_c0_g1_i1.p1  ORF type:complete len:819 (+),score=188.03 TRINITY_DN16636_c0_g1_i1:142-2598(+)
MQTYWQDLLFKVIASCSCLGIAVLLCVVGLAFLNPGAAESSAVFVKPLTLGSTFVVLCFFAGMYWEREYVGERMPQSDAKLVLVLPVFILVALFVPLFHVGFVLGFGIVVLLFISTFKGLEQRLRGIAVCDALLGLLLTEVFRRGGAWEPSSGSTPRVLLGVYAVTAAFQPLCLFLASFLYMPVVAWLSCMTYAILALHAGVMVMVSAGVAMDEIILDTMGKFSGEGCIRSFVSSPVEWLFILFQSSQTPKEYTGPPPTRPLPEKCIPVEQKDVVKASLGEGALSGLAGFDVVVFFLLVALFLWALMASCAIFPPPIRVSPTPSSPRKKGPSVEERLRAGLKASPLGALAPCLLTLGKGVARLICVAVFGFAGVLLALLGGAVLTGGPDSRRLAPGLETPVLSLPAAVPSWLEWSPASPYATTSLAPLELARELAPQEQDYSRSLAENDVWPPPPVCIEDGVSFMDRSIWRVAPVYTPEVCQEHCQGDELCLFFTFLPDDLTCDLKAQDLGRRFHTKGISGPKYCTVTTTPPPRNESWVPIRLDYGCLPPNETNETTNETNSSLNGTNETNGTNATAANSSNRSNSSADENYTRPSWNNGTARVCDEKDVFPTRRRRSYDEYGLLTGNKNLESSELINCTDRDWCLANVTIRGEVIPLARCVLPHLCSGCSECWPPCRLTEAEEAEAAEAAAEVLRGPAPSDGPASMAWAYVPAKYIRLTWCEWGAVSSVIVSFFAFLVRGYAWSLSMGIAQKFEMARQNAIQVEKRKISRELGISVRELENRKKKMKKQRKPLVMISPEEDMPKEKAIVNGGRIFAV